MTSHRSLEMSTMCGSMPSQGQLVPADAVGRHKVGTGRRLRRRGSVVAGLLGRELREASLHAAVADGLELPGSNSTPGRRTDPRGPRPEPSGARVRVRSSAAETPGSSGPHSPADSGTTGSTETPGPSGSDSPGSEPNSEALGSPGSSATADPAGGCCGSGGAATLSVPQAEAKGRARRAIQRYGGNAGSLEQCSGRWIGGCWP